MSKTTKTYKGKKYKPRKDDNKSKKKGDKKFFGHTSGQHSRGVYDSAIVDGKFVQTKTDRAPEKGEDFVKYGWPFDLRNKKVKKRLIEDKEAKEEIRKAKRK